MTQKQTIYETMRVAEITARIYNLQVYMDKLKDRHGDDVPDDVHAALTDRMQKLVEMA